MQRVAGGIGSLKSSERTPPVTMTTDRIGGDESSVGYFLIFLLGVALGNTIRVVAFLVPDRIVRKLEAVLLGHER